jgi:hypothetical protein
MGYGLVAMVKYIQVLTCSLETKRKRDPSLAKTSLHMSADTRIKTKVSGINIRALNLYPTTAYTMQNSFLNLSEYINDPNVSE